MNKCIKRFVVVICLISTQIISQTIQHIPLELGNEDPDSVEKRLANYIKLLGDKYDTLFSKESDKQEYIKQVVSINAAFFENGEVYYNWFEAESYLLNVAKAVLGDKMSSTTKVKIVRSPEDNAFMVEDGIIYINVGLLANANSEAELASIIGHEYGHYINLDSYKSFKIWKKSNKQQQNVYTGGLLKLALKSSTYANLRELEKDADMISLDLLISSKYNPHAFTNVFKRYSLMQKKYEKIEGYKPAFFNDHPSSPDRVNYAAQKLKSIDTSGRREFIVDESFFKQLKQRAIDETILLHMFSLNFNEVIEVSYRELLKHPNDEFYLFYINEGLRRILIVDPEKKNEFFISGRYNIYSKDYTIDKKKHVFTSKAPKNFDGINARKYCGYVADQVVFLDEAFKMTQLPKSPLSNMDTIEFVSNQDAFEYFSTLQKRLNYSSGVFTNLMLDTLKNKMSEPILSEINFLNKYNNIYEKYNEFVYDNSNKDIGFVIYNIEAQKGEKKMYRMDVQDCTSQTLRNSIYKGLGEPNEYGLNQLYYDTISRNDRKKFLLFANGVISNYTKKIKLREISFSGVNSENIFVANPISIAPEIIEIVGKQKQQATALISISIYYKPELPMAGNNAYSQFVSGFGYKPIQTSVLLHVLDYKHKRIIEKAIMFESTDDKAQIEDLKTIHYIIANALTH